MTQKDIIINILKSYVKSGDELTAREIFQDMEPSEKNAFTKGQDQVSKVLCLLRDAGIVENGISNIVDGRSKLTWRLTKQGQAVEVNAEPDPEPESTAADTPTVKDDDFLTEMEHGFAWLIQSYKLSKATTKPIITNKPEKIGLLNLLKSHYGHINSDFETVLNDIIADLEQLEAA